MSDREQIFWSNCWPADWCCVQLIYFSQESITEETGEEVRTVAEKIKKIECDPKCGFAIQSHDEKEIIDVARQHAKKAHSQSITEKDVRGMMKDA